MIKILGQFVEEKILEPQDLGSQKSYVLKNSVGQ